MITQSKLKQLVKYDPDTGEFVSLADRGKTKCGQRLGCKNRLGYIEIGMLWKKYKAHTLAFLYMTGEFPDEIDHADGDPSNNKWSNLRLATRQENMWNRGVNVNSQTGVKGVHPYKDKFKVQFRVFGKKVYLGLFNDLQEAKQHHDEFVEMFQGEFVCNSR